MYIFTKVDGSNNWIWEHTLTPEDEVLGRFGHSVAIFDETIVVGAPNQRSGPNGVKAGNAHIYTKGGDGWESRKNLQDIVATDARQDDQFGNSVAVYEDTVIVGVPNFYERYYHVSSNGAAYVFQKVGTTGNLKR